MSHDTGFDDNYFITKRQKRTFDKITDQSPPSISEIRTMFAEIRSQQDSKFESLNNALLAIMAQNKDIQNSVETMTSKHEQLLEKINVLEQENLKSKNQILALELKVETLEKHARNSMIEIRNLPKHEEENKGDLVVLLKKIGLTLGVVNPIEKTDIRDIYRMKSGTIVVDFTTVLHKESVLSNYKKFNRSKRSNKEPLLHSEHLELPGPPRPVYIAECLSTNMRRLFYVAREYVKTGKLIAAWISFGRLLVKKEEGSAPVRVNEESEIHKIIL